MFYKFLWTVVSGKKLWRTIGFPTANIPLNRWEWVAEGTYSINALIDEKVYRWVWVYRDSLELFEAHFFDFDLDIYGKSIEISLYHKIRDNMCFENVWDLKNQIQKDVDIAKKLKYNVLTFWTFDILHPGHEYYLNSAKMHGNSLITIVATAKNREKTIGNIPRNSLESRVESLALLGISDIIEEWSEDNPMVWLDMYKPKVICLWYDQKGFSELLDEASSGIDIIRIDSYYPEQFKSSKLK